MGCAFSIDGTIHGHKLHDICSVHTAEQISLKSCLEIILASNQTNKKYLIHSDSTNTLNSLSNPYTNNPLLVNILNTLIRIIRQNNDVRCIWIPSHKQIEGNEMVDQAAKEAKLTTTDQLIPCLTITDVKPCAKHHIIGVWRDQWDNTPLTNKLRQVKPDIEQWISSIRCNRDEEILVARLRLGHSRLTHSYLIIKDNRPICPLCGQETVSIEHLFTTCGKMGSEMSKVGLAQTLSVLGDNEEDINKIISIFGTLQLTKLI